MISSPDPHHAALEVMPGQSDGEGQGGAYQALTVLLPATLVLIIISTNYYYY